LANDVALQPSRLPINPALAREYDLTAANWRVLVESIFPAAKTVEGVLMALAYCKQRGLDVFKRPIHIVPIWDNAKKRYVETCWEGIASIRTTASRTGAYAGIDAVEYGPTIKREFHGEKDVWERGQKTGSEQFTKTVEYPEWASVTVYRMIGNQRCAFHAKVFWAEACATQGKTGVPNEMWSKRPFGQIDKCCEAAALRKAFPEELGSIYTVDEMEGQTIEGVADPAPPAPPKPPVKEPKLNGPPKPPARQARPEVAKPVVKEPFEVFEDTTGRIGARFDENTGEVDESEVPGDLLSELDDALSTAKNAEEVATIYTDYEVETRLAGEFIGVALGIRRRHLKRVQA
jgi:phage recombination protein Bet